MYGVIGYGQMGKLYLRDLTELGVPQQDLIVFDRRPERLSECAQHYPGVTLSNTLADLLSRKPEGVFILTNSPEHLAVIQAVLHVGIEKIFVEKPLVLPEQKFHVRYIAEMNQVFVGYQINFSPAFGFLLEFMKGARLEARETHILWGKDRFGDERPTGGNLEDEATHGIRAAMKLIAWTQSPRGIDVQAGLSFPPYMKPSAQEAAHEIDMSYPLQPNATTDLHLCVRTDTQPSHVFLRSSFVSFEQVRRIDVLLTDYMGTPSKKARLEFDYSGVDRLLLSELGPKATPQVREFPAGAKLRTQTEAVLEVWKKGGDPHPQLTKFEDALLILQISDAATRASKVGTLEEVRLS